ncbi:hypothetical protein BGAL_0086g00310 [Botrytis galanthina]|uniref:Galactose oxidase n=1 Tax=Botrytis galanthina TaxID=278940 RepID=A0A4S8RCS2_9HELO|nr:hypothetical protein BGAL_0086g00310 [Botrytis galanthina]
MIFPSFSLPIILALSALSTALPQSSTDTNLTSNPGSWHRLPSIPLYPRQEHTTVYLDPYIYILGGIIPSNSSSDPYPTTTLMQRFSLTTNTWSRAADLPLPLNHANAAILNGAIYLLGGLAPDSTGIWLANRSCYRYDPSSNTWTQLFTSFPSGLQIGAAAVARRGNTIYLAGGLTYLNISETYQPSVSYFTAYTAGFETWTSLPALPQPRDHAGKGFIGDNGPFYVIGGRQFGHDNVVGTNYMYDFQEGEWSEKKRMITPRGGVASAVVGERIFVIGGEGNPESESGVFEENEAYDTERDQWRSYAPMDVPRHGTSAVAVGNRIYVPGGGLTEGGDPTDYFSYFEVPY